MENGEEREGSALVKEQTLPCPSPEADVTVGQEKPVSSHMHLHPNASRRKLSHQEHSEVHAVFSIFYSWPQVCCWLEAAPVVCRVEVFCVKESSLGAELSDLKSLINCPFKDTRGKHYLQRKRLLSRG